MPTHAAEPELRLALISIIAAAGVEPATCARLMDESSAAASRAGGPVMDTVDAIDPVGTRFGALRALAHLCAACSACPRGQAISEEVRVMTRLR